MKPLTPGYQLAIALGLAALLAPSAGCLAAGASGAKGAGHQVQSERRADQAAGLRDAIDVAGTLAAPSAVPEAEPASLAVLGAGLVGFAFLRRRGAAAAIDRRQKPHRH